jgi:hypothetical protein
MPAKVANPDTKPSRNALLNVNLHPALVAAYRAEHGAQYSEPEKLPECVDAYAAFARAVFAARGDRR